ncbi:hypothetical protein [Natronococcus occultus]|uniref:Uncharacterized protein n=1 Tax=Natronococcus occultus SP4 TaxID=694430 RepID=L0K1Q8_9EURY|nr:hypothetical protein [Natronococcus occultus]AGB38053.1 hypothetical protein Natoc_2275 [Natronococcus occultus SP4]
MVNKMEIDVENVEELPDYWNDERIEAYAILELVERSLDFRMTKFRVADQMYKKSEKPYDDPSSNGVEVRNQLLALSTQMFNETISILEGLAAVSKSPTDPPEERAKRYYKYSNREVHEYYESIGDSFSKEEVKKTLNFPSVSNMNIHADDRNYYRRAIDYESEKYFEFYKLARDTWDVLKQPRDNITHGFRLQLENRPRPAKMEREQLPEGIDDFLITIDKKLEPTEIPIGERAHEAYFTIAGNAVEMQKTIINALKLQMQNCGDPLFPGFRFAPDNPSLGKRKSSPIHENELWKPQYTIERTITDETINDHIDLFESIDSHVSETTKK